MMILRTGYLKNYQNGNVKNECWVEAPTQTRSHWTKMHGLQCFHKSTFWHNCTLEGNCIHWTDFQYILHCSTPQCITTTFYSVSVTNQIQFGLGKSLQTFNKNFQTKSNLFWKIVFLEDKNSQTISILVWNFLFVFKVILI